MNGLPLAFVNPWALAGLAALPVLWWLLRFLPPLPKKIFLPTTRFLIGLKNMETTPDTAPWWLIALRLSILACLIFAFSGPVLNPRVAAPGSGPLRLVFDNGWASGQTWTMQMAKAEEILAAAAEDNRPVQLQLTASDNNTMGFSGADEVRKRLRGEEPVAWPGLPEKLKRDAEAETVWISTGLAEPGFAKAAEGFADNGGLTLYLPDMKYRAGLMRGASAENINSLMRIEIPTGAGERSVTAQAFDTKSRVIGQLNQTVSGQSGGVVIEDEADRFKGRQVAQWRIPAFAGAGGIYLNDVSAGTGVIGIATQAKADTQNDFSDAAFYISRAAAPFAKVATGNIEELIAKKSGVIALPDIASFSPGTLSALEKWIRQGGVLLRFGGKSMSEVENVLVPVPLKTGMRSLSGDLSWTTPLKLAAFPKASPFAGEKLPDISVERQLLAQPSADLESHVWAQLSDGTPFITARPEGRGLIVLVHTTATPDWSDFVLSGFYVRFLKIVTELSSLSDKAAARAASLQPVLVLNGWGQLEKPGADVRPVSRTELGTLEITRNHPPGYYGGATSKFPVNLGDHLANLDPIDHLPDGAKAESLTTTSQEKKLAAFLSALAAVLFLLDWLVMILSAGPGRIFAFGAVAFLLVSGAAKAESGDIGRAATIHLACVKGAQDALCQTALYKLSNIIKSRTSVELGGAVTVDLDKDDLSFYPLIYWPIDPLYTMSAAARENLSRYLGKGGMVLIDTQDGAYDAGQIVASPNVRALRDALQGIDIPPLKPAPKDFVLFKSFYLLNFYPEYDLTGKLWVEDDSIAPAEDLSSVIVTGQDWLRRWTYPEDPRGEEMAYRFGLNLVIYALTGNYKSDQVHMKAILERMGR